MEWDTADETGASLGAYLRQVRQARGLTQWEIAHELGTDQAYVSKIERGAIGAPNAEVLAILARALGVPLAELLRRTGREVVLVSGGLTVPVRGYVPADRLRWAASEGGSVTSVRVLEEDLRGVRDCFGLEVRGDCLRAVGILDGDVVIVEPAQGRAPRPGQLVVIRVGDEVSLKRYVPDGPVLRLEDGDGRTVEVLEPGEDVEVLAFWVYTKQLAHRG